MLQAVLTHKGRSSSSGHYVAWVRRKDGKNILFIYYDIFFSSYSVVNLSLFHIVDEWLMFDDDNVTAVTSEDILKLSGGGEC